jgi:hypothetical protein
MPAGRKRIDRRRWIPVLLILAVVQVGVMIHARRPVGFAWAALWLAFDLGAALRYWRRPVVEREVVPWRKSAWGDPWEDATPSSEPTPTVGEATGQQHG